MNGHFLSVGQLFHQCHHTCTNLGGSSEFFAYIPRLGAGTAVAVAGEVVVGEPLLGGRRSLEE